MIPLLSDSFANDPDQLASLSGENNLPIVGRPFNVLGKQFASAEILNVRRLCGPHSTAFHSSSRFAGRRRFHFELHPRRFPLMVGILAKRPVHERVLRMGRERDSAAPGPDVRFPHITAVDPSSRESPAATAGSDPLLHLID